MKMKWKSALLASFVGMGLMFGACSNEDKGPDGPDVNPPEEEMGFVSFTASTYPGAISKATTEDGDKEEAFVTGGFMVLYETNSTWTPVKVAEYFKLEVGNTGGVFAGNDVAANPSLTHTETSFIMDAKEVKKNDYLMLVVLNPTEDMVTAAQVGQPYTEFEKAQASNIDTYSAAVTTAGREYIRTGITMSNSRGLVKVLKSQFKKEKAEAELAADIPVVGVDRILAKVTFSRAANIETPKGGTFGEAAWILDITNKSTFWVRKQTLTAPYNGGGMEGPTTNRDFLYAEDTNWEGLSQKLHTPTTPDEDQLKAFNYLADSDIKIELPADGSESREYVLENTMAADEQWEDVTTRILIRGNFIPDGFDEDQDYYYFRGFAFTHTQIHNMYMDRAGGNKNYPWPDDPRGLQEAVEEAMTADVGFTFDTPAAPTTSVAGPNGTIAFYKEGISYYAIRVRHFSDKLSPLTLPDMNFGRYGVVRNNVYNVTLTRVAGPGSPSIPKPEGPDDKEEKWISADINVLPWVVRTQPAEI